MADMLHGKFMPDMQLNTCDQRSWEVADILLGIATGLFNILVLRSEDVTCSLVSRITCGSYVW